MSEPVLYGAAYSVYVRSARLALAEKGVAYRLQEVDIFAEDGPHSRLRARGIPALRDRRHHPLH